MGFSLVFIWWCSQAYAPITGKESAFHRTLFVFMCPSRNCLLRDQREQCKWGQEAVSRRYGRWEILQLTELGFFCSDNKWFSIVPCLIICLTWITFLVVCAVWRSLVVNCLAPIRFTLVKPLRMMALINLWEMEVVNNCYYIVFLNILCSFDRLKDSNLTSYDCPWIFLNSSF